MSTPIRLKKCIVSQKYLKQVQRALKGEVNEHERRSIMTSTLRYIKKWDNDHREQVVFYNPKCEEKIQ